MKCNLDKALFSHGDFALMVFKHIHLSEWMQFIQGIQSEDKTFGQNFVEIAFYIYKVGKY